MSWWFPRSVVEGGWKMDLWARIWALRLETGRWGKLEKEKEASRPQRSLEFEIWGRNLGFEARIWVQRPYEGG